MFITGIVKITAFIKKLNGICQSKKSVRKSRRNINLILFLCGESNTCPLPELRRTDPNVDSNVQSFPLHHPAQFRLRTAQLVMQSPHCSSRRTRMVVLNKAICDAEAGEFSLMVSFQEKATSITEHLWSQFKNTG